MLKCDDLDMEIKTINTETDAEIPWSDEDRAEFAALCANPVVKQQIRRQEAKFRAWARGQEWAKSPEARVISRAASQVSQVVGPAQRTANPAHHTQVGGDASGDSDSSDGDADSHVIAYHQYITSLISWTSALEVIATTAPGGQSVKKYTHLIANHHIDLAEYQSDFTPDYSQATLRMAATGMQLEFDYAAIQAVIQPGHKLHQLFLKFTPPAYPGGPAYPNGVEDFGWLVRQRDQDRKWYNTIERLVRRVAGKWAMDSVDGEDIVADAISRAYHGTLKGYDASYDISLATYASYWVRDAVSRAIPRAKGGFRPTNADIGKALAVAIERLENFDRAHQPPVGVESSIFLARRSDFTNEVEKWQKAKRRGFIVIGCESLTMAPSLSDADGDGQIDVMDICADLPDAAATHSESSAILEVLLSALTARERQVVHLRYLTPDQNNWDEVAASIGATNDTAKRAHRQALAKMRDGAAHMGVSLADLL